MFVKNIFENVSKIIKKIYFKLFYFMAGTQTNKSVRSYVHFATTLLFILSPVYYYNFIIQLFASETAYILEHLGTNIIGFLVPALLACGVKFTMFLIGETTQKS